MVGWLAGPVYYTERNENLFSYYDYTAEVREPATRSMTCKTRGSILPLDNSMLVN